MKDCRRSFLNSKHTARVILCVSNTKKCVIKGKPFVAIIDMYLLTSTILRRDLCYGLHFCIVFIQARLRSRIGLAVIQRNVRKFLFLRNWTWWKLYIKVQPLLSIARAEDEMKEKEEALAKALEQAKVDEENRKQMETQLTDTIAEKEKIFSELQAETDRLIAAEDKLMQTQAIKVSYIDLRQVSAPLILLNTRLLVHKF